jgi:hypothetical protein
MKSRDVSMIAVAAGSFALAFAALGNEGNLQTIDTNKDGMISVAEHAAGARQMFRVMDADTDGRVTAAEHEAGSRECSRIRTSTATAISRKRSCRQAISR